MTLMTMQIGTALNKMAKNIKWFEPSAGEERNTDKYLQEMELNIQKSPSLADIDELYLIHLTCDCHVKRLPGVTKVDVSSLCQAVTEESHANLSGHFHEHKAR